MKGSNIASWLQQHAENHPSTPFVVDVASTGTRRRSTEEFSRRVASLSSALQLHGIKRGKQV